MFILQVWFQNRRSKLRKRGTISVHPSHQKSYSPHINDIPPPLGPQQTSAGCNTTNRSLYPSYHMMMMPPACLPQPLFAPPPIQWNIYSQVYPSVLPPANFLAPYGLGLHAQSSDFGAVYQNSNEIKVEHNSYAEECGGKFKPCSPWELPTDT